MHLTVLFAIEKLKPIDPDINKVFLLLMSVMFISGLGVVAWQIAPIIFAHYRVKRSEKIRADNDMWFNAIESTLHRGHRSISIEKNSIEYYVCKLIFASPYRSREDGDIFDARGQNKERKRGVYQAVNRLNKKASESLGLENNLFNRNKEDTFVNDIYRPYIVKKK